MSRAAAFRGWPQSAQKQAASARLGLSIGSVCWERREQDNFPRTIIAKCTSLIKDGIVGIANGVPEFNLGALAAWRETNSKLSAFLKNQWPEKSDSSIPGILFDLTPRRKDAKTQRDSWWNRGFGSECDLCVLA